MGTVPYFIHEKRPGVGLSAIIERHGKFLFGKRLEPDKMDGWEWFEPTSLPAPLFGPTKSVIDGGALEKARKLAW